MTNAPTPRVALITGGGKGIGRGIGLELAAQGWAVAFCYRTSGDSTGQTAAAIRTTGATTLPFHADVSRNVISPGFVSSGSAPEEELQKMLKNIPAGYIGQVNDAVSVVKFLLSDEARYVNGANVHLSGGWGL